MISSGRVMMKGLLGMIPRYEIGRQVQIEWEIGESIGNGLLEFKQTDLTSRWLKSKVIDLSKYKGKSILQGKIESIMNDGRYILDVARIYQIIDSSKPNILKKYYSIALWVYVDTSDDENYFVDIDASNNIFIKDLRTFRPAARVSQFRCDSAWWDKDCVKMVRDGETKKKQEDNFISLNGLKYYKLSDWRRFVDDKQGRGYHVTVTDDRTMYYLSRFVFLLDKQYISGKIYDRLTALCRDNELVMNYSDSFELKNMNNNRFAILKWRDDVWNAVQCEIFLDDSSKQNLDMELVNMLPL